MTENRFEGVCTEIRCQYSRLKPKATWFNQHTAKWVCFPCAQKMNAFVMRYAGTKPCISDKEHMIKLLTE